MSFNSKQAVMGMQAVFFGTIFIWTVAVSVRCWNGTGYICKGNAAGGADGSDTVVAVAEVVSAVLPKDIKTRTDSYVGKSVTIIGSVVVGNSECETTNVCDPTYRRCCNPCKSDMFVLETDDFRKVNADLGEQIRGADVALAAMAELKWDHAVEELGVGVRLADGTKVCTRPATQDESCAWECPSTLSVGSEYTITGVVSVDESVFPHKVVYIRADTVKPVGK